MTKTLIFTIAVVILLSVTGSYDWAGEKSAEWIEKHVLMSEMAQEMPTEDGAQPWEIAMIAMPLTLIAVYLSALGIAQWKREYPQGTTQ